MTTVCDRNTTQTQARTQIIEKRTVMLNNQSQIFKYCIPYIYTYYLALSQQLLSFT